MPLQGSEVRKTFVFSSHTFLPSQLQREDESAAVLCYSALKQASSHMNYRVQTDVCETRFLKQKLSIVSILSKIKDTLDKKNYKIDSSCTMCSSPVCTSLTTDNKLTAWF